MRQLIINLRRFFDTERKKQGFDAQWAIEQTAKGLEIGEATVRRVMAEYNKNAKRVPDAPQKARGRPDHLIPDEFLPVVRKYIRSQNLVGQYVSLDAVRAVLIEQNAGEFATSTIWRTLGRWGFTHGTGMRRSALRERDYVILARRAYLRRRRLNRNPDGSLVRPEVYLDETFINRNHSNQFTWYWHEDGPQVNKPAGKGERIVIVNAITKDGWVKDARLIFEASRRTGDYHGQMNWDKFSRWFTEQLIPNMPKNSIIHMDNASYHNTQEESSFPKSTARRELICEWLDRLEMPWGQDMLKSELYELIKEKAPPPVYKIDKIAEDAGHSIVRTPQYHPELQPIETCWAVVKNFMARQCDFTLKKFRANLPDAFAQVTDKTCRGLVAKAVVREDKYWTEDIEIEERQRKDSLENNSL